ncbi:hypothetical protein CANCADRAFT_25517, partial [Tortispora caseinolytica NRRL Y-17796]
MVSAAPIGEDSFKGDPRDVHTAAIIARKLIHYNAITTVSTVQQEGDFKNYPLGLMEYYADCSLNGEPTYILIEISSVYRQWAAGSPIAMEVHTGHFGRKGLEAQGLAAAPRVSLQGNFSLLDTDSYSDEEMFALETCFLRHHPDAVAWLPGKSMSHSAKWAKFDVEHVYYIGGFGNVAYIGDIDVELYKNVSI